MRPPWVLRYQHETIIAVILMIAAWRALSLGQEPGLDHWVEPDSGPTTLIPNLATDDSLRLSWLPGVGTYRAKRIVAERPMLQVPLTPERLELVPGVGETTAREVHRWYRRQVQAP